MDSPQVKVDVPGAAPSSSPSFFETWKKKIIWWAIIIGTYLLVCWILTIYDEAAPIYKNLKYHGIRPRTKVGLLGIIAAPFLHISVNHMLADTAGVLILGGFMMVNSLLEFFGVTVFVWFFGGLLTWCVARAHYSIIGCGLLCFGWFGYLIVTPFFKRPISIKAIGVAALVGILYGGMIFAIFPHNSQISWEACLCCLLAGVIGSVTYWYLCMQILPRHFAKFQQFKIKMLAATSSSSNTSNTIFQKEDPQKGAIILPQPNNNYVVPQKSSLLNERSSPFGNQDTAYVQPQQQPYPNSFEPAWLHNSNTSPYPPPPASGNSSPSSSSSSISFTPSSQFELQPVASNYFIPPTQATLPSPNTTHKNDFSDPFKTNNNNNNNTSWLDAPVQSNPFPPAPANNQVTFNPFD